MSYDALGYYKILNATAETDTETLKINYREMAKKWHPDYNTESGAMEIFQKLSVAYETLQDDEKRQIYNLLSQVYTEKDYPDVETIEPFMQEKGTSVRVLNITDIRGKIIKTEENNNKYICSYSEGLKLEFKKSLLNWCLGWWSLKGILKTPKAIISNIKKVNERFDNLKLLIHNTVAYYKQGNKTAAVQSAIAALPYATTEATVLLKDFIAEQNIRVPRPSKWNFGMLKVMQLLLPLILIILSTFPYSAKYISEADLMRYFSQKKEISYYQEVDAGGKRGRTVDDVIVSKIINIPVDKGDDSKLYHVSSSVKVMYGPDDDFDVLKEIAAGTTVRLTGRSPDNIWARIMIDNGEMGFLRAEVLQKGIGTPIPEYSEIILHY